MTDLGFGIALPDGWNELDGPNVSAERAIRDGLTEELAATIGADQSELRRTFVWWLRQAKRRGLSLVAAFAEEIIGEAPAEPTDEAAGGAVIGALMALSFMSRESLQVDGLRTLNPGVIIAALERDVGEGWQPLRPPARVDLSCGTGVERSRIYKSKDGIVLEVTYYLPLIDGEVLGVLSFVTPSVFVADEFIGLFRTIADSLEVFDERPVPGPVT